MHPIPCNHCAMNFMRPTIDPEVPKLCNSCLLREEKRNPKGTQNMSTVDILIKCPRQVQIDIEEICMVEGINFSDYFLQLHRRNISPIRTIPCNDAEINSKEPNAESSFANLSNEEIKNIAEKANSKTKTKWKTK